MYGKPDRKTTRIWTNCVVKDKVCDGKCGQMVGRRHKGTAQKGPSKQSDNGVITRRAGDDYKTSELYSVPSELASEICADALSSTGVVNT